MSLITSHWPLKKNKNHDEISHSSSCKIRLKVQKQEKHSLTLRHTLKWKRRMLIIMQNICIDGRFVWNDRSYTCTTTQQKNSSSPWRVLIRGFKQRKTHTQTAHTIHTYTDSEQLSRYVCVCVCVCDDWGRQQQITMIIIRSVYICQWRLPSPRVLPQPLAPHMIFSQRSCVMSQIPSWRMEKVRCQTAE